MKVLVIPFERYPTDESFLEDMFTRPQAVGDTVFLMRGTGATEKSMESWGRARVFLLPEQPKNAILRRLAKYFMDLRYISALLGLVRRERPDVVLVRDLTFPLFLALIYRGIFGFATFYQRTFPYEYSWFDPHRVQRYRFPALWKICRSLESAVLHHLLRYADAVLPISKFMKSELVESDLLDPESIHPFGMGIDEQLMRSFQNGDDRLGGAAEDIRFVYVGSLAKARRIDLLLEAIALATHHDPPLPFRVDFIGGTPEEINQLMPLAQELGLAQSISFLGRYPRERLYEALREYDCGLVYIPNDPRYWISCPTKLIECLSIGIPCIATDTAKTNVELADQTGAVIIAGSAAVPFSEGILSFLGDPRYYLKAAKRAPGIVREEYSYETMRKRFVALCTDALLEVKIH